LALYPQRKTHNTPPHRFPPPWSIEDTGAAAPLSL